MRLADFPCVGVSLQQRLNAGAVARALTEGDGLRASMVCMALTMLCAGPAAGRRKNPNGLGAALLAALDDDALAQLAERLRPHLDARAGHQPLLTPAQAAERLRLHPKTIVRMARDGRLPGVKVGAGWRFQVDQLDIAPAARLACSTATSPSPRARRGHSEPASVRAIRGEGSSREGSAA